MTLQLQYGLNSVLPDDAIAAWGARMIITQDGGVDIVPDRTDFVGSDFARDCLRRHLEAKFPPMTLIDSISDRLRDGQIRTREATDVVLYEDDRASVVGNSNASAGYFYVSAWLKP